MAKVAVVILNYNGKDYLKTFLPVVLKYSQEADVIVADNASTDDSVSFLEENHSRVKLIKLEKNHGFAGGYNKALAQLDANYFVLLNSDVEVSENWLKPMISFMDEHQEYAACQPKVLNFNKKTHFEYAGAAGGYLDALGYPFCRGRIFNTIEEDRGQYNDEVDIFWATGACMVIRSDLFLSNGGFDQDFFAHMEEIDLCWRIISKGHKIRYIPLSSVFHVGGGTLAQSSPFKTYLNFRNSFNTLIKNLPFGQMLWKLPIRWAFDWLAVLQFSVKGEFKHALAILKAHLVVILHLKKTISKRNETSSHKLSTFSIVFKYFFSGKRAYSAL